MPGLPGAKRVERLLLRPFEVAFRLGGGWPLALESFDYGCALIDGLDFRPTLFTVMTW